MDGIPKFNPRGDAASALDREIQVMRGFASCRGDEDRINEAEEELSSLRAELARMTAQRDAILMQARIWSGEAKAQKATVDAVVEILGGVPDWGPIAQGVEQLRAELAASREREARMRAMIADDGHAMTFQSLGQYRTSLLRALAEGAQG